MLPLVFWLVAVGVFSLGITSGIVSLLGRGGLEVKVSSASRR